MGTHRRYSCAAQKSAVANLEPILEALEPLDDVDPDEVIEEEDETFADAVAEALKKTQKDAWHRIQNNGYAKGKATLEDTVENLEEQVNDFEQRIEELKKERDQLAEDNPDLAELREEYKERINELEQEKEEIEQEASSKAKAVVRDMAADRLRTQLSERIDSDVVVKATVREIIEERFEVTDDLEPRFSREDSDAPVTFDDEEDPIEVVTEEVVEDIDDPALLKSTSDRGGGSRQGGGPSGGNDRYDEAEEEGKEMAERESNRESKQDRLTNVFGDQAAQQEGV